MTQQYTTIQLAQQMVDGLPGMYKNAAAGTKNPDEKQLLLEAASTFQAIIGNPDTRMALVQSLIDSPLMEKLQQTKK